MKIIKVEELLMPFVVDVRPPTQSAHLFTHFPLKSYVV